MKRNFITFALVATIVSGIVVFNMVFEKEPITAAQKDASEQAAETIKLAEAAGEAAKESAPKETATAPAKPEAPAKDVPRFDDVETADEWPETAPDTFKLLFRSSTGDYIIECNKEWAPVGVERFYQLCKDNFYDGARYFRVIPGFMVQFGLAADPADTRKWDDNLKDDPVLQSNTPGMVSFATAGPNTRTTQVFINYGNNARLDGMGFAPFGKVVRGMENVEKINPRHGESPNQGKIKTEGNEYLSLAFPDLDYVDDVLLVK